MMRVVVLSFWHVHARDYANAAVNHPDVELAGIWDTDVERGQAAATQYNVPFFANLDDVLNDASIGGVIVTTPTVDHLDVMTRAARAGKHIFTEKVIAATMHEANHIMEVVRQSGITFVVNMYRRYNAYSVEIKKIIDSGALGELSLVRVRDSHNGALRTAEAPNGWLVERFFDPKESVGGVLTDLCHPVYLTRYFLGMPDSVMANYGFKTGRLVDDNVALSLRYANGAVGIVETSFTMRYAPFSIEIHGTEGSLIYEQCGIGEMIDQRRITAEGGTVDADSLLFGMNRVLRVRSTKIPEAQNAWQMRPISADDDQPPAFNQWVSHIQAGTSPAETDNHQLGLDLTAIVEAANLSATLDRGVAIKELRG